MKKILIITLLVGSVFANKYINPNGRPWLMTVGLDMDDSQLNADVILPVSNFITLGVKWQNSVIDLWDKPFFYASPIDDEWISSVRININDGYLNEVCDEESNCSYGLLSEEGDITAAMKFQNLESNQGFLPNLKYNWISFKVQLHIPLYTIWE